jgi:hypothetical protein
MHHEAEQLVVAVVRIVSGVDQKYLRDVLEHLAHVGGLDGDTFDDSLIKKTKQAKIKTKRIHIRQSLLTRTASFAKTRATFPDFDAKSSRIARIRSSIEWNL